MVEIVRRSRKSPVLTPSKIPCLHSLPTINITQGCLLGCVYCYIQGYPNYPGRNRIVLFENTPRLLKQELRRRRLQPKRVYFSPSSDAFQGRPEVDEVSLETMRILLEAGVEVAFLTKGFVTDSFLQLFRKYSNLVFAQVGLTTLEVRLCRQLEPNADSPNNRLATIQNLIDLGITTTARLDPLVPDLTDTTAKLHPLLLALHDAGIRRAAASFLFVRPQFAHFTTPVLRNVLPLGSSDSTDWTHQRFLGGKGGGRMIDDEQRRRRFALVQGLGAKIGIAISSCLCKNPGLGTQRCAIAGPSCSPVTTLEPRQLTFPT